jgi:hypothetical protein
MALGPHFSMQRRLDLPGLRQDQVREVQCTALRARESTLLPHLRIACREFKSGLARIELVNSRAEPVRIHSIEVAYVTKSDRCMAQSTFEPVDVVLEPGESRSVDLKVITWEEVEALEAREGEKFAGAHFWFGRASLP